MHFRVIISVLADDNRLHYSRNQKIVNSKTHSPGCLQIECAHSNVTKENDDEERKNAFWKIDSSLASLLLSLMIDII